MASSLPVSSSATCCILLVYGIPGSGKSALTDYLCSESVGYSWSMLPIHFDSFYPLDTRASPNPEKLVVPFVMKRERQQVSECIERFIQLHILDHSVEQSTPQLWDTFTTYLQDYGYLFHSRPDCRFLLPSPSVLVLDDNLPLRSMRYQFYQMAKKYQLGFAELCVCCEVTVAQARNTERQISIPNSTIFSMGQRLELPEPSKHHWERWSAVLLNNNLEEEFLTNALVAAKKLISEAFSHPEQPTPLDDSGMKETCRVENLESYLHQADIILRKCVSSAINEYRGSERGSFAKGVNSVRKELLEQARTGGLIVQYQLSTVSATSSEFESTLQHLFRMKLDSQFHV